MFGQICRRINELRVLDVKIGEVNDFEAIAHVPIDIYNVADGIDELDDALRHEIARRRFAAEHECARRNTGLRIAFQSQIKGKNVQRCEVLTFVFVNALHLNVEK